MDTSKLKFLILFISAFFLNCSSGAGDEALSLDALNLTAPTLYFPNNNEACLDGLVVNDTQSTISFSWLASINASSYKLTVKNLSTQSKEEYTSSTTSKDITLNSSEPYSWFVSALAGAAAPVDSATWKFYLAGTQLVNYAPFPAEILSPRSNATITAIDGFVSVKWNCTDVDDDLLSYEVFMDSVDATTSIKKIDHISTTTETTLEAQDKTTYYWKIVAEDANGNKSSSGVYSFITS